MSIGWPHAGGEGTVCGTPLLTRGACVGGVLFVGKTKFLSIGWPYAGGEGTVCGTPSYKRFLTYYRGRGFESTSLTIYFICWIYFCWSYFRFDFSSFESSSVESSSFDPTSVSSFLGGGIFLSSQMAKCDGKARFNPCWNSYFYHVPNFDRFTQNFGLCRRFDL